MSEYIESEEAILKMTTTKSTFTSCLGMEKLFISTSNFQLSMVVLNHFPKLRLIRVIFFELVVNVYE